MDRKPTWRSSAKSANPLLWCFFTEVEEEEEEEVGQVGTGSGLAEIVRSAKDLGKAV